MKTKTQTARQALHNAQEALRQAVADDYPIGRFTRYLRGRNWISCVVVGEPSNDGRVKVRGVASGKEYWIDSFSLEGGSNYT